MGIIDKLNEVERSPHLFTPPSQTAPRGTANPSLPSSVRKMESFLSPSKEAVTQQSDGGHEGSIGGLESPNGSLERISYLEAPLIDLSLEKLVWAPLYSYGNCLFPARKCGDGEASRLSWIKSWPLPDDEMVVEILCQTKVKDSSSTLIVKKKDVRPLWSSKEKGSAQSCRPANDEAIQWSEDRMEQLRKVACR